MSGSPVTCDMVNRDRNILGMETPKGGEESHSDDAELIAVLNTQITEDAAEWTRFVQPLEYESDAAPTMANVILAAGDYFGGAEVVGRDNSLTVDDVTFVYYSRLSGIKVAGVEVEGFNPDVYSYTVSGNVPVAGDVEAILLGGGKSATASVAVEGNTVKVTVSNAIGADVDGESSHVYTLNYVGEAAADIYEGVLDITWPYGDLAKNQPAKVEIVKTGDNECTLTLPNFALDMGAGPMPLGDIVVPKVAVTEDNGKQTLTGSVKDFSLLEGEIIADINLDGTIDAEGNADLTILVNWNELPINVKFIGKKATSGIGSVVVDDAEAPVEYYNLQGVRVQNPESGLYIRRQGNKVSKILVK